VTSLRERTELEKIEVFPDGRMHVHMFTIVERDGKEIARIPEISEIERGGQLPAEGLVKTLASILWNAAEVRQGETPPNFKKGALYYTKGETTPRPQGIGKGAPPPDDGPIIDLKAATIKHKGGEQRGIRPSYSMTSGYEGDIIMDPKAKTIKHRGKEHKKAH
jgi:hypothetical protein